MSTGRTEGQAEVSAAGEGNVPMAPTTARDLDLRGGGHPAPSLLRGEPEEVYSRITAGDPLRIEERCALRLFELALLE